MPYCLGKGIWGPAPDRERMGLRGHLGLGGALAMGWRMLALGTQAQWTVDGLSEGCDVWASEHPVARHECFPRLVMCPLFFKRDCKSE